MQIQLETFTDHLNQSFTTMFNPRLSDLFYWHFHPEFELVYINNASGTRHVGDHVSSYEESDLVLIGSNIPHLNFDYGVKTDYQKVVVHINHKFVASHIHATPELSSISLLLKKATYGIAFNGEIKSKIGKMLFALEELDPLHQYLQLLFILDALSRADQYKLLHDLPYTTTYNSRDQDRLRSIYAYVDNNYHRKIVLKEIASISNMSKEAFCRYFKKATRLTFVEFLNRYRISQSKRLMMAGKTVSHACYHSGFESLSYFNRIFKKTTSENPSTFRKRYVAISNTREGSIAYDSK